MDVEQNDFEKVVSETAARAERALRTFDHPLELDRRLDATLDALHSNSHTFSIEGHPDATARNRAGLIARRLALNPADQRRLNRDLVAAADDLDERTRRHDSELAELRAQVNRLLAFRRGEQAP